MKQLLTLRNTVRDRLLDTRTVRSVLDGTVSRTRYARYLMNVYQYARHSPVVIALAASRCMGSHPNLAKYLLVHAEEERGHDLWALADLRELGVEEHEARSRFPVPACSAKIAMMYYTAGYANPVGLFGWLYVLEAMGDDLGSTIARRLDEGLQLQGRALRFLAGHGVNDVEHTAGLTEQIGAHVRAPQDLDDVHHVGVVVGDLYVRMFDEIYDEASG